MKRLFDLSGKTAIVTGGSRGIGAMIARGFVENGVKTYITSRSLEDCQTTAKALSEYGQCIAMASDLSNLEGIDTLVRVFSAKEEKLDILVNNAGIVDGQAMDTLTECEWDRTMAVNVKAVFFLTQKLLSKLRRAASVQAPARVINIASVVGMQVPGADSLYPYTTSKAGVIHLTRHLAARLTRDHITVNAISPAMFPNRRTEGRFAAGDIPLGRIGTPEDIAGTAIFLSSRAGAWLTGTNIPVDGGYLLKP